MEHDTPMETNWEGTGKKCFFGSRPIIGTGTPGVYGGQDKPRMNGCAAHQAFAGPWSF